MSLWVDKYRPRSIEALTYHSALSDELKALAASGDFPHILVYGPSGAGKKTRVMAVLKELYGNGAEKIKIASRVFQIGTSSRKVEFNVVSSNYHIEFTPSDMGNNDRVVIQDLLKEIAQTQSVDTRSKNRFKTVVINEADSLSRDAQAALRRTMEKYSANIRLVLLANSTSNIISPIKSRTLLIRVPAPSAEEIGEVILQIAKKEKVLLPSTEEEQKELFDKLTRLSHRNLRKCILMFEAMYSASNGNALTVATPTPSPDWEQVIGKIADEILRTRTVANLLSIRGTLYDLIAHCIPPETILRTLTYELLHKANYNVGPSIVEAAAFYFHRLRQGSKAIFHLEACIAKYMQIIETFHTK
ncbi:uncharacterized protein SAPINGB_P004706 [Magnusiomyces paraingens]|uniref:Replication factor C subunit 5 n=1 Tax=Magnusiomyces paraingens TaxID=2606893 RepID=A0A5E8BYI0_9ASCO|nr:uncharacterized protein SAPINGB_P004706 [Saprochaete ingens]VVT55724.1 unnamed protein product [Saprochaete ingens]